ncbi:MAG: hypothetical protein M1147_10495 [Nitrospirae bacterium]|nr:hypothetical protein [Nitrospirota bacterium]MCL5978520.1 hypothetical protein [Nitrospirota bacterium]
MKWILIGIAVIVALYLAMVIPAGVAVLISEKKFKKSPYREDILAVIKEYWTSFENDGEKKAIEIINKGFRESIQRNGQNYSIDITGSKIGEGKYEIIISVGLLKPITIGHAEKFIMDRTQQSHPRDRALPSP